MTTQAVASRRSRAAGVARTIAGRGIVYPRDPNVAELNPGFFRLLRIQHSINAERGRRPAKEKGNG